MMYLPEGGADVLQLIAIFVLITLVIRQRMHNRDLVNALQTRDILIGEGTTHTEMYVVAGSWAHISLNNPVRRIRMFSSTGAEVRMEFE